MVKGLKRYRMRLGTVLTNEVIKAIYIRLPCRSITMPRESQPKPSRSPINHSSPKTGREDPGIMSSLTTQIPRRVLATWRTVLTGR